MSGEKPRLLIFYAPSQGLSRRLDGYLAQILQRRQNHETFTITRIDVTKQTDTASRFGVVEVPTILVVDEKRVVRRLVAPKGVQEIEKHLSPWLLSARARPDTEATGQS